MSNKKRILLVEDDPNFGIILRDFLKMNEYDVILAKNGMEGFEKFKYRNLKSIIRNKIFKNYNFPKS